MKNVDPMRPHFTMDIRNLIAPVTLLKVENKLTNMTHGQVLEVVCVDEETKTDLARIAKNAGHGCRTLSREIDVYRIFIEKR